MHDRSDHEELLTAMTPTTAPGLHAEEETPLSPVVSAPRSPPNTRGNVAWTVQHQPDGHPSDELGSAEHTARKSAPASAHGSAEDVAEISLPASAHRSAEDAAEISLPASAHRSAEDAAEMSAAASAQGSAEDGDKMSGPA